MGRLKHYEIVFQLSTREKVDKTELATKAAIALGPMVKKLKAESFMTYGLDSKKK